MTTYPAEYHGPAIESRYLGPTDHRGSRIKALVTDGSAYDYQSTVTVPYPHDMPEGIAAHMVAVAAAYDAARARGYFSWITSPLFLASGTARGYRFVVVER